MRIVFIDGMGGGLVAQVISQAAGRLPADTELIGLGTNALATAAMLKAGLKRVATGENAVCVTGADGGYYRRPYWHCTAKRHAWRSNSAYGRGGCFKPRAQTAFAGIAKPF